MKHPWKSLFASAVLSGMVVGSLARAADEAKPTEEQPAAAAAAPKEGHDANSCCAHGGCSAEMKGKCEDKGMKHKHGKGMMKKEKKAKKEAAPKDAPKADEAPKGE